MGNDCTILEKEDRSHGPLGFACYWNIRGLAGKTMRRFSVGARLVHRLRTLRHTLMYHHLETSTSATKVTGSHEVEFSPDVLRNPRAAL
jgi:hypothetical protein